jgi:hypothetical protein
MGPHRQFAGARHYLAQRGVIDLQSQTEGALDRVTGHLRGASPGQVEVSIFGQRHL